MKTAYMTALFSAMIMLASTRAGAEASNTTLTNDPLMKQIMSRQLTVPGGGVTGAVRIGSGQTITLSLIDPLSAVSGEPLKDAVADPKALAGLKPAAGLAAKPVKSKSRRKVRRDSELLKKMSDDERRADWSGRK